MNTHKQKVRFEKGSCVPLTNELLNEIVNTSSLDNFFATNHVNKYTLEDYLAILIESKDLKQADVIRQAGVNYTYGYEFSLDARSRRRAT